MKYLLENEQAKNIDNFAINNFAIPSIVLMENAARSAAEFIITKIGKNDKILILCGIGNNGGDGLALARHLYNFKFINIDIYIVGNLSKITKDNQTNLDILKKIGLVINYIDDNTESINFEIGYNVIIDALLGIGAKNELKGIFATILNDINKISAIKFAIDVPTGVDSNTGKADENAFIADHTVTMFSPKLGLYINQGKNKSGEIIDAYLGVSDSLLKDFSNNYTIEISDLKNLLPSRKSDSSKFDYGRILIIAGSEKYSGAAALSSNASIKAGNGLVELLSTHFHSSLLPEIIQLKAKSNPVGSISYENINFINEIIEKYDVIVIGPGLSNDEETIKLVKEIVYNNQQKKIILDADGLKALTLNKKLSKNIIITPHIYEFINTFKLNKEEVLINPYYFAKKIAKEYDCNILLKNVPSIITNGEESYFNVRGNNGMSTAGSGDVLTGIISYYTALLDNMLLAGAIGAFIHSYSGDIYAHKFNKESLTASELINQLKEIKIE